jgi:hypothetical protein
VETLANNECSGRGRHRSRLPRPSRLISGLGRPRGDARRAKMRLVATALLVFISGGCRSADEPLPDVPPTGLATLACSDAAPPSVLPIRTGSELGSCLSASQLRGETTLAVHVARDGTVTSVEPAITLCLVVDDRGHPLPKLELTSAQQKCLVERLRSWRFAAFDTCAPQLAYVQAAQSVFGGLASDRRASRGGPAMRCS